MSVARSSTRLLSLSHPVEGAAPCSGPNSCRRCWRHAALRTRSSCPARTARQRYSERSHSAVPLSPLDSSRRGLHGTLPASRDRPASKRAALHDKPSWGTRCVPPPSASSPAVLVLTDLIPTLLLDLQPPTDDLRAWSTLSLRQPAAGVVRSPECTRLWSLQCRPGHLCSLASSASTYRCVCREGAGAAPGPCLPITCLYSKAEAAVACPSSAALDVPTVGRSIAVAGSRYSGLRPGFASRGSRRSGWPGADACWLEPEAPGSPCVIRRLASWPSPLRRRSTRRHRRGTSASIRGAPSSREGVAFCLRVGGQDKVPGLTSTTALAGSPAGSGTMACPTDVAFRP